MRMNRSCSAVSLVGALVLAASAHAREGSREKVAFDIDAPSLVQALMQFTQQSGLQLMVPTDRAADGPAPKVIGSYTPTAALDRLLAGTTFRYEFANPRTVAIRMADVGIPAVVSSDEKSGRGRSDTGQAVASSISRSLAPGSSNAMKDSDTPEVSRKVIPEILVKGSRSANLDIERTRDDALPYVVFDRDKISQSDALSLEDFFKTQLPMNAAAQTIEQQAGLPSAFWGSIDLRGLGSNQTLILVDGRRLASGATQAAGAVQANISGIPLSAIERIEVLPSTASAIYGGGATGGAINIVRKRDYSGVDVSVKYGNAFSNDAQDVDLSVALGKTFWNGRTAISLSAAHSRSGELLVAERDFALRSREALVINSPTALVRGIQPVTSNTANVCSATQLTPTFGLCNTSVLVLDNGTSLSSSITSVPHGYQGSASDSGAALAAGAGSYNLEVPDDGQYLLRSPERTSLSLNLRQKIVEALEFQLDGFGSRSASDLSSGGAFATLVLPGNAPNNPFTQTVAVAVPMTGLTRPGKVEDKLMQGTASIIARLPREWSAVLDRGWSRTSYSYEQTNGQLLSSSGLAALGAVAFSDAALQDLDLRPYATSVPDTFGGPYVDVLESTSLRLSGPVMSVPAGALSITALAEHKGEHVDDSFIQDFSSTVPRVTLSPKKWQSVDSYYLETRLPIFGGSRVLPLLEALEIQASGRRDEYKTKSTNSLPSATSMSGPFSASQYFVNEFSSTDFLAALRYAPIRGLTFRGSLGTGFLPPGLNQIAPVISTITNTTIVDPMRGGTRLIVPYTQISGGNPSLQPEHSRSWSAGLILTPELLGGFRLSVDYTHVSKTDEILGAPVSLILENEAAYPGRVIRGAKLATDPAEWAGPITSIDVSLLNVLYSKVESLDVQLDYSWKGTRLGDFSWSTLLTQARGFERQLNVDVLPYDSVGYSAGPLEWKGNASLMWKHGSWRAAWGISYFGDYRVTSASPTATSQNAQVVARQGSDRIGSETYHDVRVSYQLPSVLPTALTNLTLSLGVQNLFNKSPAILVPLDANVIGAGTYSSYADPRLRRYYLSVQTSFGK